VLVQCAARLLVVDGALVDRVADVAGELRGLTDVVLSAVAGVAVPDALRSLRVSELAEFEQADPADDGPASEALTFDPWCVMFTSGTSGPSKGAVMTHQYWYVVPADLCGPGRGVREDDVFYVSSPMFHAAAWLVQIFPSLMLGLPVAIDRGFSISGFWESVRRYGASQLLTMGATHLWLYNQEPRSSDADNPARVWAPVPLPAELWEPFKARFGVEHLWVSYGGTEFMAVARARSTIELAVMDGHGCRLPAGEVGELCVRPTAPHAIFQGYLGLPEFTLERLSDLWYHTGDLVRIDSDGELFFLDRKDDYLRVRGENVSSFEVETAISAHPAIAEVAAQSVRSEESALVAEDEIKVCVILKPGMRSSPEEIIGFAAEQLPRFAVPRFVEIVDDLPRTPTGRVQKHVLRSRGCNAATWDRVASAVSVNP
jgi:crotonobetaine/carnitine-CoA ligase